jgi:hypothetical protein
MLTVNVYSEYKGLWFEVCINNKYRYSCVYTGDGSRLTNPNFLGIAFNNGEKAMLPGQFKKPLHKYVEH